ncbi:uncharacterized protein LOC123541418 [Mercenaria mercenaria]|uniref:uncharacterized protein LOC123541418 n=1 Tax=Mercenaria mercenaria TaxID=6596 RepID=UPI00234F1F91|nr:uncharacterized protein LOC123541418 [Mercenaria mercenaria]
MHFPTITPSVLLRNQHYCRTIILNLTFGTAVMRELVIVNLRGKTIEEHLNYVNRVKTGHNGEHELTPEEADYLRRKRPEQLDLSRLTRLLLCTMLDGDDFKDTNRLRIIRNKIAHPKEAELADNSLFRESGDIIKKLAKSVDKAKCGSSDLASDISAKINELEMTELVQIQHIDSMEIKKEYFWTKVIRQCPTDTEEHLMQMKIRYGLIRYTRQLSAELNIDLFLAELIKNRVIEKELKTDIEQKYSFDEQMAILVDHLVQESNDDSVIIGAFECLKRSKPNGGLLAALVEGSNDDCEKFESLIQDKVKTILNRSLKYNKSSVVQSSEVHIFVEKEMKIPLAYDVIKDCIKQTFRLNDKNPENDSLKGLCWKESFRDCECKCVPHDKAKNEVQQKKCLTLRPFDKPAGNIKYSRCYTDCPGSGDLLEPKHKFISRSNGEHYTTDFISRECIRFADACINSAQNGTIHFGIMHEGEQIKILGIQKDCICYKNLDFGLQSALNICFKENINEVKLVLRQVQRIPVDEDSLIIEIDVVPFHGYFSDKLVPMHFPPKGVQKEQYNVFNGNCIEDIHCDELQSFEKIKMSVIEQRKFLQEQLCKTEAENVGMKRKLRKILTDGRPYLTELYSPIIVTGNINGCPNEDEIRTNMCIENAFTSCKVVFEFDSSSNVRETVESENDSFKYYTSESLQEESLRNDAFGNNDGKCWIYCNGYENAESPQEKNEMNIADWNKKRKRGVKEALNHVRDKIQRGTCKMIFLIYQKYSGNERDPMLEMARDPVLEQFTDECVIIAENESYLTKWKEEFKDFHVNESLFFTGLSLASVLDTIRSVFKANPDVECILPASNGSVCMTKKEMSTFQDIVIVNGKECILEIENLDEDALHMKMVETRNNFYRGTDLTWWNFHFAGQIGKRKVLDTIVEDVYFKLEHSNESVELCKIYHQPGAGGTTVGKHIIWLLSQYSVCNNIPYRCCILHENTTKTFQQMKMFRHFKDKNNRRPIILLIDDHEEEEVDAFTYKLRKYVSSIKHFCCIISIHRIKIQEHRPNIICISLKLEKEEQQWFELKSKELENIDDIGDINTLIAFNFMKTSFDEEVILRTAKHIISGIKPVESQVLKCLALISKYEKNRIVVPIRVFDVLTDEEVNGVWCSNMSESMQLMIKEQYTGDSNGISILCQPLAKAIIRYFEESPQRDKIEDFVSMILDVLERLKKTSGRSENFNVFSKIVCSLLKRNSTVSRQKEDNKWGTFADLVNALRIPRPSEEIATANKRSEVVLQRCFDITSDAMVGQQLTRLYILECRFEDAQHTIEKSIKYMGRDNSYLIDTYGNIYKAMMTNKIKNCSKDKRNIKDGEAAEIVRFGLQAIDTYRKAQKVALREHPKNKKRNLSCFFNELNTLVTLLGAFSKFQASDGHTALCQAFLTSKYDEHCSPYKQIVEEIPRTMDLLKDSDFHRKVEDNLRFIESQHQLVYYKEAEPGKVLSMRRCLQQFYDCLDEDILSYPTTLFELQDALETAKETRKNEFQIKERVETIQKRLKEGIREETSDRDLLLYIGYFIVKHYGQEEYRNLLFYSNVVIESQLELSYDVPILEVFLYHAVLHWPTNNRALIDSEHFCQPTMYRKCLQHWEDSFHHLHGTQYSDCVFAVINGAIGSDILNIKQAGEGKIWYDDPQIRDARFDGKVHDSGKYVSYEATYSQNRRHEFFIETDTKCSGNMKNKTGTFILGFTWKGPRAFALKVRDSLTTLERRKTASNKKFSSPRNYPGENHSADGISSGINESRYDTDKYGAMPKKKNSKETSPLPENSSISNLKAQTQIKVSSLEQNLTDDTWEYEKLNNRRRRLIDGVLKDEKIKSVLDRKDLAQALQVIEREKGPKMTLRVFQEEIQKHFSTRKVQTMHIMERNTEPLLITGGIDELCLI